MKSSPALEEYWRQHVRAFESSGMTRVRFCFQKKIKTHQLDYWRRRFHRNDPAVGSCTADWIPLEVRDGQTRGQGSGISLRIGLLTIEVKPGFDREFLQSLLAEHRFRTEGTDRGLW